MIEMPRWLAVTITLIVVGLCVAQLLTGHGVTTIQDAFTYFEAWEKLKELHPSEWRPPVYPIILGCATDLLGMGGGLIAVLLIQWGAYLGAASLLWQINESLGMRRGFNTAAILALMLWPGLWVMNNFAMAESLAGSALVVLIWLSMRFMSEKRRRYLWCSAFTLAALIFTKPVFVTLLPIFALFWVCEAGKNVTLRWPTAVCVTAICLLTGFYAWQNHRFYQVWGLTRATTDNLYYLQRQDGLISTEDIANPQIRSRLAPRIEADCGRHAPGLNIYADELWLTTWAEKDSIVSASLSRSPLAFTAGCLRRLGEAAPFSVTYEYEPHQLPYVDVHGYHKPPKPALFYPFGDYLIFPIWAVYIILGLYFSLNILRKHLDGLRLIVGAVYLVGLSAAIFGAMDSWGRLMANFNPLLPTVTLLTLQLLLGFMRETGRRGHVCR